MKEFFNPLRKIYNFFNPLRQVFQTFWLPSPLDQPPVAGLKMINPLDLGFLLFIRQYKFNQYDVWHIFHVDDDKIY